MKVKDLLKQLNSFDPDLNIICYNVDEEFTSTNKSQCVFEINYVKAVWAERSRNYNSVPKLKFDKEGKAENIVLINVTSDF